MSSPERRIGEKAGQNPAMHDRPSFPVTNEGSNTPHTSDEDAPGSADNGDGDSEGDAERCVHDRRRALPPDACNGWRGRDERHSHHQ